MKKKCAKQCKRLKDSVNQTMQKNEEMRTQVINKERKGLCVCFYLLLERRPAWTGQGKDLLRRIRRGEREREKRRTKTYAEVGLQNPV